MRQGSWVDMSWRAFYPPSVSEAFISSACSVPFSLSSFFCISQRNARGSLQPAPCPQLESHLLFKLYVGQFRPRNLDPSPPPFWIFFSLFRHTTPSLRGLCASFRYSVLFFLTDYPNKSCLLYSSFTRVPQRPPWYFSRSHNTRVVTGPNLRLSRAPSKVAHPDPR